MKLEDVQSLVEAIDFGDDPMAFVSRKKSEAESAALRVLEDALLEAACVRDDITIVHFGNNSFMGRAAFVYQVWEWVRQERKLTPEGEFRHVTFEGMAVRQEWPRFECFVGGRWQVLSLESGGG